MNQPVFFTAGDTAALQQARNQLLQWGYDVSPAPSNQVTHLLLPVPSFEKPGVLKGNQNFDQLLDTLPPQIKILGGNLPPLPYKSADFLQDEYYLTENAAITAQCTVKLIHQQHTDSLENKNILIIGWGRIARQLAPLLKAQGAIVSVAARKDAALEAVNQLDFLPVTVFQWDLTQYDMIINTAPALLLDESETDPSALLIDLASSRGISGGRVIWARGLPSKEAPDISGILIAKTALRYALGKEHL